MPVVTGLESLSHDSFVKLRGKRIGVVCNQATVDSSYRHLLDLLAPLHRSGALRIEVALGPQHGLFGHTQDNMIEWEGGSERSGFRVESLYGKHREPTPQMLENVELLVLDLPDIGSRYYTFIWTTALCLKACEALGIPVLILDRPNPIGGIEVEGTVLDPEYASFVGLYPLPTRHGMTLGEIATYLAQSYFPGVRLEVESVQGWARADSLGDTLGAWVMPSPNMPTTDTALVYPGGCLLEGTNLSEGRGTTRPFEQFGAPYIDGRAFASDLAALNLPGVYFRPIEFQPTFQKHAGALCQGCFVHVLDRRAFRPVLTYVAVLQTARRLCPNEFAWNPPPYEYEHDKLPIDILAGNSWLRSGIDGLLPLTDLQERFDVECAAFDTIRKRFQLYR